MEAVLYGVYAGLHRGLVSVMGESLSLRVSLIQRILGSSESLVHGPPSISSAGKASLGLEDGILSSQWGKTHPSWSDN